ncbi:MAG: 4-(cytidine 5'-diphospho)-2-C-methyl-D-erythritol kinase [Pseudomonadota bacterium]|nr:4-(cytidine 5'-diphospho)-2-C-methyl-D-erythritol kinase [Pseudomonadota bacterium]
MHVIHAFAPAKLNLYLHITGRRADGYHDLDSLVAFASVGDHIRLERAESFAFALEGPQAAALAREDFSGNLIVAAARSLAELTGRVLNVKITLVKNLPVASGIGGGSSDAAAVLRALAGYWAMAPQDPQIFEAARRHGQDVPVCLMTENNYITTLGTAPAPVLPHVDCVLVNPGQALPTPAVYKSYRDNGDPFSPCAQFGEAPRSLASFVEMLLARRNDLYDPACRLLPTIGDVIEALEASGSLLARMSGSGATCFGFYPDRSAARAAAAALLAAHPSWWVAPAYIPYKHREAEPFAG